MTATAEAIGKDLAFAVQARGEARLASAHRRMADAVRVRAVLDMEPVGGLSNAPADSDPLTGMEGIATVLWSRFHKFDAADPRWPDRDRFVLSAARGTPLLLALLHLTGHDGIGLGDGIETLAGPPGQGLATAVGMALAERMLAARFGRSLVDHRTWVIAGACDLMAGISHEAAGLAGQLRLEKLTVIAEDGPATDDGVDALKRFAATGWAVKRVDAGDPAQAAAALSTAIRSKKPTLIAVRAADALHDGAGHEDDDPPLASVRDSVLMDWRRAGQRGASARRAWLKRFARHPLRAEFERVTGGRLPEAFHDTLASLKTDRTEFSTRDASERALAAFAAVMPELIGGAAGNAAADANLSKTIGAVGPGNYAGRFVPYGQREQGMAAALNGAALHGGLVPCGTTCLAATDALRPALRFAAIMRQRVVYVLAQDGIVADDSAAHVTVEQMPGLRATPNLHVFRPADPLETIECWELALRRADGPSLLALSAQAATSPRQDVAENRCARGGYVRAEANGARQATLIASGPEVALALAARDALATEGIRVAVVSLPCWELFAQQDEAYRAVVLGGALRVGIEAASGFGWERWLGAEGAFVGISGFGASGGADDVYKRFGMTPEAVATLVRRRLSDWIPARKD